MGRQDICWRVSFKGKQQAWAFLGDGGHLARPLWSEQGMDLQCLGCQDKVLTLSLRGTPDPATRLPVCPWAAVALGRLGASRRSRF